MNNRFTQAFHEVADELLALPRAELVAQIDAMRDDPFMSELADMRRCLEDDADPTP